MMELDDLTETGECSGLKSVTHWFHACCAAAENILIDWIWR